MTPIETKIQEKKEELLKIEKTLILISAEFGGINENGEVIAKTSVNTDKLVEWVTQALREVYAEGHSQGFEEGRKYEQLPM